MLYFHSDLSCRKPELTFIQIHYFTTKNGVPFPSSRKSSAGSQILDIQFFTIRFGIICSGLWSVSMVVWNAVCVQLCMCTDQWACWHGKSQYAVFQQQYNFASWPHSAHQVFFFVSSMLFFNCSAFFWLSSRILCASASRLDLTSLILRSDIQ